MKNIFFFFFLLGSILLSAQKKTFFNPESLLKSIKPDSKIQSWTLIYNEYAKNRTITKVGNEINYIPQFSGFKLNPEEDHFYYIAYLEGQKISYVQDLGTLKTFLGTITTGEEAALATLSKGYFVDVEYKDYAANYQDLDGSFAVEVAKITSQECPIAKSHFLVTINKNNGEITEEKDLGIYSELYKKDCKNNPHYAEIQKQIEEAKLRAEEQKKIQKEMTEKMRKKLEKKRRKD